MDVVVTYAIMRRDIEQFIQHEFSLVALDEAQHIKNRSTQMGGRKAIGRRHRLVLTGTPVENLYDLWSIMDFMPGYLGGHEHFRTNYSFQYKTAVHLPKMHSVIAKKLHPLPDGSWM